MLPLCNGINGKELLNLYIMCKKSAVSMYHALKFELLKSQEKVLSIATYLHFLDRLNDICADHLPIATFLESEYLGDYLHDDE